VVPPSLCKAQLSGRAPWPANSQAGISLGESLEMSLMVIGVPMSS
jgi:hypothetical protein